MTPEAAVSIILRFTDSARTIVAKHWQSGFAEDTLLTSLSLPAVDSMLKRLGVTGVSLWKGISRRGELTAWPRFARPPYIPIVRRELERADGVLPTFSPIEKLGDGSRLTLVRHEPLYVFTFERRWGDCLVGCINSHTWIFEVNVKTGAVKKRKEFGTPL